MKLACQFCLYVVIKSIFLTLNSVFFFFFFLKKENHCFGGLCHPSSVVHEKAALSAWEKVNVQRKTEKGKEK